VDGAAQKSKAFQEGPPDAPPPASVTAVVVDLPPVSRGYAYLSHFAALTSASKMLPLLVQTKRDRLMRLAASTVPQALQHCEVSAGSMTMIRDPYLKICTLAFSLANEMAPRHPKNRVASAMPGAIS
jgi:hypothetical protein